MSRNPAKSPSAGPITSGGPALLYSTIVPVPTPSALPSQIGITAVK